MNPEYYSIDEELDKYEEAARFKGANFPDTPSMVDGTSFNASKNVEEVFTKMPNGGHVKIAEREITPEAKIMRYNAALREQGITPTADDFYAAGFDDQQIAAAGLLNIESTDGGRTEPLSEYEKMFIERQGGELYNPPELTFGQKAADLAASTGRVVGGGIQDTITGLVGTADDIGEAIGNLGYFYMGPDGLEYSREKKEGHLRADKAFEKGLDNLGIKIPEGDGPIESLARGLMMFASGMTIAPVKGVNFLSMMLRGGFADALLDPEEGNISTLAREYGIDNAILEFLDSQVDEEASALERLGARLTNTFEGVLAGGVIDGLIKTLGFGLKKVKGDKSLVEYLREKFGVVKDRLTQPGDMPTVGSLGGNLFDTNKTTIDGSFPGRISTRLPTAKASTEDAMTGDLIVGLDEMKADPALYEFNVNITKDYPNMLTVPNETVDETAERFIEHVKDNLLYLHDKVPNATRARSQKWYDGARAITDNWSTEYGIPDTSIAGALAALSPQKDWYQNVSLAKRVLDVAIKQKDFKFANEMEQTFRSLPSLNKPKYEPLLDLIKGKSYSEIVDEDPAVQATLRGLFVRLYDQTYNKPDYQIVGPEGDFLDIATNADGSPSKAAWGSLNEIGKAVASIDANGDVNTISVLMGERHKVRNFYNNIYSPNSLFGDVTIDTHAVAAGLLRPLSGNSLEVDHNFKNMSVKGRGTTKGSSVSGVSGNYGLYAEAYRRAAAERGILPRQMQSITWEAVRGLFTDKFKQSAKNVADIDAIWQRYKSGEIDLDETRRLVDERAGGINPPSWE
tara:strand:+ start:201 stop:2591 length:2391 start_codon:yes stop_codon:yes gene_type:complete